MGIWRQTAQRLLPMILIASVSAVRESAAEEALLFPPVVLEESPSVTPGHFALPAIDTRISDARWYASADALMLMRDSTPKRAFQSLNSKTNIVLDTDDLEANFQAGPRITLGRRFGERFQFEYSWFQLGSWDDRAAVRDETANAAGSFGNMFSPFSNFGDPAVALLDYNDLATIEYRSTLDNMEFNLRQKIIMPPGPLAVSVLVGARHLDIRERFAYATNSITPLGVVSSQDLLVEAGNDLWGVQIGALLEFQVDYRCQIVLDLKGGIFNNAADQSTIYTPTVAGVSATSTGSRAEDVTAWVGEILLAVNFQLTPHLSTQIGYQMLWVEGIALASENFQSDVAILATGPTDLIHDGHVVYHGPHIGMVLRF